MRRARRRWRPARALRGRSADAAVRRRLTDAWELSRDERAALAVEFGGRPAIAAPIAAAGRALGVIIVGRRSPGAPDADALALATAAGRALGLAVAHFDSELLREEFIEHAISAQEEERRAIARELHDGLGQSITALMVGLRSLEELVPDTAPTASARALTRRLAETALAALEETGRMARGLRPSVLDDVGLVAALERHVADFRRTHGIVADLHVGGLDRPPRVPSRVETTIYRVVQEALTNVARHASASTASVILEREPGRVRLIVEDDGRGLDEDALVEASGRWKRLGLLGIRERVGLLGGDLTVESSPGQGTALYVQIPLPGG